MVRVGNYDDLGAIVGMAEEFWSSTVYEEEFCPDSVEEMAKMCIDQELMSVLVVDDEVCGFACGLKGGLLGNAFVPTGIEVAWWVNPDHRTGAGGVRLLKHIESRAKSAGIKYWSMVYMESSMPETIKGIYEKMGYFKNEVTYTKVL